MPRSFLGPDLPGLFGRRDNKTLEDRFPLFNSVHELYGQDPNTHIPARQQQQGRGAPGLVNAVFGGPDDPRLTPQQNAALKRKALINAGIATLLAGGRGHDSLTLGQAVGVGVQGYQQTMTRGQRKHAYGAIMQRYGGKDSPMAIQKIMEYALQTGDKETAHEAAYMLHGRARLDDVMGWQNEEQARTEKAEILNFALDYGFPAEDVATIYEPLIIKLFADAKAYSEMKAAKKGLKDKIRRSKTRTLQPGKGRTASATSKRAAKARNASRERLRRTGTLDDWQAAIFGLLGEE